MSTPRVWTYFDLVESLMRWLRGANVPGSNQEELRDCILTTYDNIVSEHEWKCLLQVGRLILQKTIKDTGTYTASTRQLVLATETFPTWAQDGAGACRVGTVVNEIASASGSTATLDSVMCPPIDYAANNVWVFPRYYLLPEDFIQIGTPIEHLVWRLGVQTPLDELLQMTMHVFMVSIVRNFAIGPAPNLYGRMGLYVYPPSQETEEITFPYKRRPRQLRYSGHESAEYQGTVSITGTSGVGVGTAFTSAMVGSMIRTSATTGRPDGLEGKNPYVAVRVITAVADSLHFTVDSTGANCSGRGYVVTDPVDLDAAVYRAMASKCKERLSIEKGMKTAPMYAAQAKQDMANAKSNDSRIKNFGCAGFPQAGRGARLRDLYRGSLGYLQIGGY